MGLTKQYLRYVPAGNFSVIVGSKCNVVFVTLEGQEGRFLAVGASEHIIIWDLRLGEKAQVLPGEKTEVTALSASPNKRHIAAGYADGNVQVYDLKSAEVLSIFAGHRAEVTCLSFDHFGHKLASGSKDGDVVVWDTVAETGICRLSDHKGPITQVVFMQQKPILITSSKDTYIKFWDLTIQHCFKTVVGHQTEVWGLSLMKDDQYLVTGCGDAELRVWTLLPNEENENKNLPNQLIISDKVDELDDESKHPILVKKAGSLLRNGKGRVMSLYSDKSGQLLGCHGTDNQIELFYFCSDEEAQHRLKRRVRKERKKEKNEGEELQNADTTISLRDEVRRLSSIKGSTKIKSFDLLLGHGGELRVAGKMASNSIELYSFQSFNKNDEANCIRTITHQGHRGETRAVAFSSDNLAIVSGDSCEVKLWNRPSQTCLQTVETGYVLSTIFVPGDRHVLAGLKSGAVLVIDIAAGDVLEEIPAHTNDVWSICLMPDLRGCATGGGDNTVKFWQFELVVDEKSERKTKILSLLHKKTLKLEHSVLCVKISPNSKFVAVALLDSTVQIFFLDTFKFYLSLYGHKLPVLCLDISADSTLIATGSSDRNVKIWGMDFGDCHKSIFAHDDSITGLQFVGKTHYFFTCGKDGKVKQWDGDNYEKIINLPGHFGEARALAVSPNGQFVVSCGSDRVLRLFERSNQTLVLEDEQEEEREQQELNNEERPVIPGQPGINLPSKKTIGSEKAAESILECLEISAEYKEQLAEHEAAQAASSRTIPLPTPHPIMQAFNAFTIEDFILETIKRIRKSDLEEALLILPFSAVCNLLKSLPPLIERGDNTELLCQIVLFLVRLHHAPIVANKIMFTDLQLIQKLATTKLRELRDMVGYNLYGMQYLQDELETAEGIQLFRDLTLEKKRGDKRKKKRETLKRSIISMNL